MHCHVATATISIVVARRSHVTGVSASGKTSRVCQFLPGGIEHDAGFFVVFLFLSNELATALKRPVAVYIEAYPGNRPRTPKAAFLDGT